MVWRNISKKDAGMVFSGGRGEGCTGYGWREDERIGEGEEEEEMMRKIGPAGEMKEKEEED